MRIAVYPGSFDPITYGHLDVVARAAGVFDRIFFAVLVNPHKGPPVFPIGVRLDAIREAVAECCSADVASRIEVESFDGLTVDFCRQRGATFIVRGLRAISDFEFEFQMALTNKKLAPEVEFVSLMTSLEYAYLSSTILKEIAVLGGDTSGLAPANVLSALRTRFRELGPNVGNVVSLATARD